MTRYQLQRALARLNALHGIIVDERPDSRRRRVLEERYGIIVAGIAPYIEGRQRLDDDPPRDNSESDKVVFLRRRS